MEMNNVPAAERLHIAFFGCRNAGKSSLVNAVTGQELSVVSGVGGTTTDPVTKTMELLPLGPVVIIDTPGFDDEGELGEIRVNRTKRILNKTDIGVLVINAQTGMTEADMCLKKIFAEKKIPYVIAVNKTDIVSGAISADFSDADTEIIYVSAKTGKNIDGLKEKIGKMLPADNEKKSLAGGLVKPGESAILVCPIDESAPKGRLILPQQRMIRDLLDMGVCAMVTQPEGLPAVLADMKTPPAAVITDSQVLAAVSGTVPGEIPLTTFSILMARDRGFLETAVSGIAAASRLHEGDKILMAEGCTHHRQCNDIGTVKIPRLLQKYCGCGLVFETCSGADFPENLSAYSMVIHCGGCMNTEREVKYRMKCTLDMGIPFTNYGITLAQVTGTLERTIRCFPEIHGLLN